MVTTPHLDTFLNQEALSAQSALLCARFPYLKAKTATRELTLVTPVEKVPEVLKFLRDDASCKYTQLIAICGVDYLGYPTPQPERFAVVYHLLSLEHNQRIRVTTFVKEAQAVPTSVELFPSANWYERETYDMYGIVFEGHPDLRRLLTDDDFEGHPLRKDFPLEGFVEAYYDATQQRVAYKPVDLPQQFRHFDRQSEWEGMTGNAPLAEQDRPFTKEEFK